MKALSGVRERFERTMLDLGGYVAFVAGAFLLFRGLGLDVHVHFQFVDRSTATAVLALLPRVAAPWLLTRVGRRSSWRKSEQAEQRRGSFFYDFTSAFNLTWPATVSTTYSTSRQFCSVLQILRFLSHEFLEARLDSLLVSSPACFFALTNA